jgi:hypothetical protein
MAQSGGPGISALAPLLRAKGLVAFISTRLGRSTAGQSKRSVASIGQKKELALALRELAELRLELARRDRVSGLQNRRLGRA